MPLFVYKAVNASGEIIEGELQGNSKREVIDRLHALGHTPIRADEAGSKHGRPSLLDFQLSRGARLSQREIVEFTRQLATLISAGLELDRALQVLIDVAETENLCRMLSRIQEQVRGGGSLSEAMSSQGKVFSNLYRNMIKAGETAGALDIILERLADYLERSAELRDSVISALIYPLVLIGVALLSVVVLLTFVLPEFSSLFEDMGATLPLSTQIIIGAGDLLNAYGWVLLLLGAVLVILFRRKLQEPGFRYRCDEFTLRLPLFSPLIKKLEVARFSQTLGTLLSNGVPLLRALNIVKETLANRVLATSMDTVSNSLKHGGGLAGPLAETNLFPAHAVHMLRVGEETGKLEEMLMKIAQAYDREVQITIKRLLALLEPVLILGIAIVIAGIIFSILLPILALNDIPI